MCTYLGTVVTAFKGSDTFCLQLKLSVTFPAQIRTVRDSRTVRVAAETTTNPNKKAQYFAPNYPLALK